MDLAVLKVLAAHRVHLLDRKDDDHAVRLKEELEPVAGCRCRYSRTCFGMVA